MSNSTGGLDLFGQGTQSTFLAGMLNELHLSGMTDTSQGARELLTALQEGNQESRQLGM